MVIAGIVVLSCLVFSFFYSSKKKKRENYFGNFLGFGFCSLILACMISVGLGNWVVPGHYILAESCILESAEIDGKERFLLKKRNNYGATTYTYFTMEGQKMLEKGITEDRIKYEKGMRLENRFKKEFNNGNLSWFFFCIREYKEVVISGEDDVFDDRHILLIDL